MHGAVDGLRLAVLPLQSDVVVARGGPLLRQRVGLRGIVIGDAPAPQIDFPFMRSGHKETREGFDFCEGVKLLAQEV